MTAIECKGCKGISLLLLAPELINEFFFVFKVETKMIEIVLLPIRNMSVLNIIER